MNATINPNEILVRFVSATEGNLHDREWLVVDVPNGWDDVKKICKKVLTYDGRKFTFTGWNSDTLKCSFVRLLNGPVCHATISPK